MKIKFIFLSCLFISLLSSCGQQEEISPSTAPDLTTELSNEFSDRLSADVDFQEIINLMRSNQFAEDDMAKIIDLTSSVVSEFPELIEMEKDFSLKLIELSATKVSDTSGTATTRCANGAAYDACAYSAWLDYIHTYYACTTNACRANANAAITQAYALCFSWYC